MSNLPARYDLVLYQGDTFSQDFTLASTREVDGQEGEPVPLDLTGATVSAQIRRRATSEEPLAVFIGQVVDPLAGLLRLRLDAEQAARLIGTEGVWDLQVDVAGTRRTWVAGNVTITPEVTR